MNVTVFGATGLTGKSIITQMLLDNRFTKIIAVVRKSGSFNNNKIREVVVDFDCLSNYSEQLNSSFFYSCLGTTIKQAGSKAEQQKVDRNYPIAIAKLAAKCSVIKMICVSSVGADSMSNNFYLKTKGEMENGIREVLPYNSIFFRPSFLMGNRIENRMGERIAVRAVKILNPLLIGSLKKYRGIEVEKLSKAMIASAFQKTKTVLYFSDFINIK